MKLTHPFTWLSESTQKIAFIVMFPATLIISYVMSILGNPLKTTVAPSGIVDYELAGSLKRSSDILASWGQTEHIYAGLGLGFDFVYILFYSIAIALGCVIVARSLSARIPILANIGIVIAWLPFVAGVLDCAENYSLIQLLFGAQEEFFAVVARWCAIPKFTLIGVGLVYVVIGTILALIVKSRK